jgi:polyhydroxyalkanoate synthesis regulator phasin
MTEGTRRPVDEAKEGIKEGVRAVTGILAALKDAIEETIDDIKVRGDVNPDRAKQAAKDTMHKAQDAFDDMRERIDFVPRKDIDALRAEVEALRLRVAVLENKHAGPHGGAVDADTTGTGTASTGSMGDTGFKVDIE